MKVPCHLFAETLLAFCLGLCLQTGALATTDCHPTAAIEQMQAAAKTRLALTEQNWLDLAYAVFPLRADGCFADHPDKAYLEMVFRNSRRLMDHVNTGKQIRTYLARRPQPLRGQRLSAHNQLIEALRLFYLSDHNQTLVALNQAIVLDPELAPAYAIRSWLTYVFEDDYVKVLADISRAVELMPEQAEWQAEYARILSYTKQYTAAFRAIEIAIRLEPEQGSHHKVRAFIYSQQGALELAIEELKQAEIKGIRDSDLYLDRGKYLSELGQKEMAHLAYLRARQVLLQEALTDFSSSLFSMHHSDIMEALEDPAGRMRDLDQIVTRYSQEPEAYFLRGQAHLQQNHPEDARRDLETVLRLQPGHKESLIALAELAFAQNDPARAAAIFEQLLKQEPQSTDYRDGLAQAQRAMGQGDLADELVRQSIELQIAHLAEDPHDEADFMLSEYWFEQNTKRPEWLDGLLMINHRWPTELLPLKYLVRIYHRLSQPQQALEYLDRALVLQPHDTQMLRARALLLENKSSEEALAKYNQLIALGQTEAYNYVKRAALNKQLGHAEAAEADISQAVRLYLADYAQGDKDALRYLTLFFDDLGRYEQLHTVLNQLIDSYPFDLKVLNYHADNATRLEQYPQAIADFEKILALEPDNVSALISKVRLLIRNEQADEAIAALNPLLAKQEHAEAYWLRGLAKSRLSRHQEALADYNLALKLPKPPQDLLFDRARTLMALGMLQAALEAYQAIIEADSESDIAFAGRGEVYELLGEHEKAQADFITACEWGHEESCEKTLTD
jgi:tetratricopeptide (TPR) repeat protein